MAARLQAESERKALIPHSPADHSSSLPWAFASFGGVGGASALGYKAVESFIASRKSDSIVFGVGVVLCVGACAYCIFRIVTSLKTRNIEPISPTNGEIPISTDRQKLLEINRRLQELFKPDDEEMIELAPPNLDLYASLEREISKIETLFPDLRTKVAELEGEVNILRDRPTPLSPPQFDSPSGRSLDISGTPRTPARTDTSLDALVSKLEALASRVPKYTSSASSSRGGSAATSPIGRPIPSSSQKGTPAPKPTSSLGSINDD